MSDEEIVNVDDQLHELLGEWDANPTPKSAEGLGDTELSNSLGDAVDDDDTGDESAVDDVDDQFDERDEHIEALEADNARLVEAEAERADRAEWNRAAIYISGQDVGVPFETVKSVILGEYVSDEDFRDAYDNRGEDPVSYQFALEELVDKFPPGDRGLSAAVIAARDVTVVRSGDDGSDNRNWSGMSAQQFSVESKQVFKDMKEGKLKSPSSGGGWFTTYPR